MTLTKFLLARIAEQEERARKVAAMNAVGDHASWCQGGVFADGECDACECPATPGEPSPRVLAANESQRLIALTHMPGRNYVYRDDGTRACETCGDGTVEWPCDTLRLLASPYADHPDYREEWRP